MHSEEQLDDPTLNNYSLLRIEILNENFKRDEKIPFGHGLIETIVNFSFEHTMPDEKKRFSIKTNIEVIGKLQSQESSQQVFKLDACFVGIFVISGLPELSLEDFCNLNGPAIIFPFVREHVANLSYKAGMPQLILPTLSFSKS